MTCLWNSVEGLLQRSSDTCWKGARSKKQTHTDTHRNVVVFARVTFCWKTKSAPDSLIFRGRARREGSINAWCIVSCSNDARPVVPAACIPFGIPGSPAWDLAPPRAEKLTVDDIGELLNVVDDSGRLGRAAEAKVASSFDAQVVFFLEMVDVRLLELPTLGMLASSIEFCSERVAEVDLFRKLLRFAGLFSLPCVDLSNVSGCCLGLPRVVKACIAFSSRLNASMSCLNLRFSLRASPAGGVFMESKMVGDGESAMAAGATLRSFTTTAHLLKLAPGEVVLISPFIVKLYNMITPAHP